MVQISENHVYRKVAGDAEIDLIVQKPPENDVLKSMLELMGSIYKEHFHHSLPQTFTEVYRKTIDLYAGRLDNYQACDTEYHDLEHTMQTAIATARVLDGWCKSETRPVISPRLFGLNLIAALLHDVGYIKQGQDKSGTGGKYSFRHVARSAEFANRLLTDLGCPDNDIDFVQKAIWCTCTRTDLGQIEFRTKAQKIAGCCLGTADLVCQMASPDYPDKLPMLFDEFQEGYEFEGKDNLKQEGYVIFNDLTDLLKCTPGFYESWVKMRLEEMDSVYAVLPLHFEHESNYYMESIESNIATIRDGG